MVPTTMPVAFQPNGVMIASSWPFIAPPPPRAEFGVGVNVSVSHSVSKAGESPRAEAGGGEPKRGKVVALNDPIIKTEAGIGFTVAGFSDWFRDAITAAGLPLDCKPHGLRHLAGVRMSEAGCTDEEMMAVLGHRSATSLRIYTKGAEQRRLAENAITKLEQNRHKPSPTRSFKFGELPKRERDTGT